MLNALAPWEAWGSAARGQGGSQLSLNCTVNAVTVYPRLIVYACLKHIWEARHS